MFEHLVGTSEVKQLDELEPAIKRVGQAPATTLFNSQVVTAKWLNELGAPDDEEVTLEQEQAAAREAFRTLSSPSTSSDQTTALLQIKSPAGIQHLEAMLTAHDWDFVARARELRSYAVTKILKETEHHDARVRLRAIELLGKITEVSLFSTKIRVEDARQPPAADLEVKVREKLEKFLRSTGQLEDAEVKTPGATNDQPDS